MLFIDSKPEVGPRRRIDNYYQYHRGIIMKHNVIKKIALTGLLGLGMALQSVEASSWLFPKRIRERYNQATLPSNWGQYTQGLNINFTDLSKKDTGIVLGAAALTCASIWGMGCWYKKYQAHRQAKREQIEQDIARSLLVTNFDLHLISPEARNANAKFIKSHMKSPKIVETRRKLNLWNNISAAMDNDSMLNVVAFLNSSATTDDKVFYVNNQGWFNKLIEAKKRILLKSDYRRRFIHIPNSITPHEMQQAIEEYDRNN